MKLSGPKLKIERAKQHINDLQTQIRKFETSGIYDLSVKKDAETGNNFIQIEIVKSVPPIFALIIGDALHNLKAALDFTVNEVVFPCSESTTGTQDFPLEKQEMNLHPP